ncbi:late endosomal/lysosomal adaptor and MAPK and MTOR activator-domain-containing protein [Aspergillus egyptiacus]|nr:late endosomal/lysosomal adaptor and MAPK and MTOR activator-domain-containing protein [Aspergillus egyptiacus]
MGICSSCLGARRQDHSYPESSRLIDDDIYQPGYGYGTLSHTQQVHQPDPGYVRREREALEAICQRTSDSVIDIWSLQPQPHLQPQATLHNSVSSASSKHREPSIIVKTLDPDAHDDATLAKHSKHWGEVVINPRKGRRSRPGSSTDEEGDKDVFGVLKVP